MKYQYVTVKLPGADFDKEGPWTERLNAVAAEGWRLVVISEAPFKGGASHFATFEREAHSE